MVETELYVYFPEPEKTELLTSTNMSLSFKPQVCISKRVKLSTQKTSDFPILALMFTFILFLK